MAGPQSGNVWLGPQAAAARGAGPRENHRERPENAQAAAAQPQPGSLIQATFPFPLLHAVLAPGRRSSSADSASASPRGRPTPGTPACGEVIKSGAPYLSSPGLNRSPSPPSPPRSAITEGRVHPPADLASLIGRKDHQSRAREAETAWIYEIIGESLHQSSS